MPDETSGPAPGRATVLLIDDDAGVLDSLRLLLEAYGYGVVTAADGRKGLAAFQKHAPAVVVTDILMPEQDGIGTIREMRRLRPGAKIIAMSGGGKVDESDYLTVAEQLGADVGIEKCDVEKLLEILPKLLSS
jgi:DNA-binding NtrC family response regulator